MRRCILAWLASGALMAGSVTKDRIITMIKAGTPESQIKDLIRQEGLAFKSTAATQSEIREAGGEVSLTAFIYHFSEEYGEAPESAEAKARRTSSRRAVTRYLPPASSSPWVWALAGRPSIRSGGRLMTSTPRSAARD